MKLLALRLRRSTLATRWPALCFRCHAHGLTGTVPVVAASVAGFECFHPASPPHVQSFRREIHTWARTLVIAEEHEEAVKNSASSRDLATEQWRPDKKSP